MDQIEKDIKMRIRSKVVELPMQSAYRACNTFKDGDTQIKVSNSAKDADSNSNECELLTEGKLVCNGSKISIKYSESADMGFEGDTVTILDVDSSDPNVVTMVRTGDGATACRFDSIKNRQICVYEVAGIPLELSIKTNKAKHCMTENGGKIDLDYIIELRGMSAQRNQMEIEVY